MDINDARPRAERRQQEIAVAARALIAERGFEGLRTRDIADRVGINVATLHYHVPTKQALIRLVAQSLHDDFVDQHRCRPREGLSPLDLLRLEFRDYRENMERRPDLLVVFAEMHARAPRDADVQAETEPMQAYWHGQFVSVLEAGVADGSFRADLDPVAAASMIICALTGARRLPDKSFAHFDALCAEILRSMRNPNAPPEVT